MGVVDTSVVTLSQYDTHAKSMFILNVCKAAFIVYVEKGFWNLLTWRGGLRTATIFDFNIIQGYVSFTGTRCVPDKQQLKHKEKLCDTAKINMI